VTSQQVSAALERERAIAGSLDGQIADVRAQISRHHQQVDSEPVLIIIIIITTITEDTRGRQHSFSNAFPWLCKEEMRFLSTTPW